MVSKLLTSGTVIVGVPVVEAKLIPSPTPTVVVLSDATVPENSVPVAQPNPVAVMALFIGLIDQYNAPTVELTAVKVTETIKCIM